MEHQEKIYCRNCEYLLHLYYRNKKFPDIYNFNFKYNEKLNRDGNLSRDYACIHDIEKVIHEEITPIYPKSIMYDYKFDDTYELNKNNDCKFYCKKIIKKKENIFKRFCKWFNNDPF